MRFRGDRLCRVILPWVLIAAMAVSCRKDEPEIPQEPDPPQEEEVEPPPAVEFPPEGEYVLPLIQTTDIHGYVVSTDSGGAVHYRLAYIADKANDLRGAGGKDRLILLDGGDLYQGASVSNLLSGWPVYVAMDRMGYDAVALGNHEFDWGIDTVVDEDATLPDYEWEGQSYVSKVPTVCANLYRDGSRVSTTRDYVILEKTAIGPGGASVPVKIGVIGFAVDYSGSIMSTQFAGKGYSVREDYSIANSIAGELETTLGCDATILLIHGESKGAAEKLGQGSPVDLVLGGHSHRTFAAQTGWALPYLQGGRYCEHYGYAQLRFKADGKGGLSFDKVSKNIIESVDSSRDRHSYSGQNATDLDPEILAVSDAALKATAEQQNDILGYITTGATTYYIDGSGERAAVISNWMCDIIRSIAGADVAFVNSGGIRTSFPLSGQSRRNISVASVYEMFPFGNHIYIYRITYSDLLKVFQYSMTSGGQSLFSRMTGLDCYFTETDHGSYSTYAVHSLRKDGTVIYEDGRWTGDWASRTLILAASEYLATTERTDYYTDLPNPLPGWNETDRLLSSDLVDNENAVRVLRAEGAASGGLLSIDTAPHFILRSE